MCISFRWICNKHSFFVITTRVHLNESLFNMTSNVTVDLPLTKSPCQYHVQLEVIVISDSA